MTNSATSKRGIFISFRMRLLLIFTILFIGTLIVVFFWIRAFAVSMALNDLQRDLKAAAITAASGVDGDAHQRLVESGAIDDSDYTMINEYLRSIKRTNPKAAGIYTFIPNSTGDDGVKFIVSGALPPNKQPTEAEMLITNAKLTDCQVPSSTRPTLGQAYTDTTPAMVNAFKQAGVDSDIYPDEWGEWLSGFAPIYNSQGQSVGAVGIDMCAADINQTQRKIESTLIPVFALIALIVSCAVFFIAYGITRPIVNLTRIAEAIGQGRYDERPSTTDGFFHDEVDKLSSVVSQMTDQIAARETKLKQQVAELQIMVDDSKRKQQVEEIVDTDFFRDLQAKARDVRSRRSRSRSPDEDE